ncbi:glycosyl hydrolase family 18 protein [Paenibacillus sp. Marseille-Q4541]|uniref:chitinase n=1 Tax=Paenibacillus sp. Marseille-Q4541 TaxID=2831522 RepID=UPI001BAB416C|nr:glycosyl hydrolase family 18 protein [Paenibacillus sp. Marseille-Q4541]
MITVLVILLILPWLATRADAAATWQPNTAYKKGDQVTYQSKNYECLQPHTSLNGWEPPNVPALWKYTGDASGGGGTTPTPDTTAPTVPTGLASSGITETSFQLAWTASTDNVGVTGYEVYRDGTLATTVATNSAAIVGLTAGTTYAFTVKAKDAAGNVSAASSSLSVTTKTGTTNPNPNPTGSKWLIGYWHNFDNGSTNIRLRNVNPAYDIINVSFAEPISHGSGTLAFTPYNASVEEFKSDIAYLQSQGKKVLISMGGANGTIELTDATKKQQFEDSLKSIINTYGFNGLDIDLEGSSLSLNAGDTDFRNPTTPKIVNLINGVKAVKATFGANFMITAAPETAYVQGGYLNYGGPWGAYLPVIHALRNDLNLLHVQHYNSGSMIGLDGRAYSQGTADFHVAMAEMLLQGFNVGGSSGPFFSPLRPDQIAIGVPATQQAAGGGYTAPAELQKAMNYLIKGVSYGGSYTLRQPAGYPGLKGIMTWSINWDAFANNQFSSAHRSFLNSFSAQQASAKEAVR